MNIYFVSNHVPDPQMVQDLGGHITEQFRGCISSIHCQGDCIAFTETLHIGGCEIRACHLIPTESIVIVEAPPLLQGAWLDAGVNTLLVPQMQHDTGKWGGDSFRYCGLTQVHEVKVVTSQWSDNPADVERHEDKNPSVGMNGLLEQATPSCAVQHPVNLFTRLRWHPIKLALLH